jgi:glycosyltransferase involved in cell wall biosynthesis
MVDTPHLSGLLGVVLAARLGLPLVVHAMADMIENPWYARERQSNVLKIALMSLVVRFATVIRVSTQSEVARLISHGIKPERIAFIPFYIDQQQFIESLTTMSDVRKPRTALCVGRLELQKDMPTLIRAWSYVVKEVPDARLRIVGTGALESSLRALTAELSLTSSVDFLGALPRAQIAAEFTKAHVFVLTSLYEGTCMVLHEAALAGLPIVSTEHAGAKDFVRDGENGYAVHIRDHRGIARALIMLFRDEALAHTMGEKSRAYARACTKEQALTSYETLLDRFVLPV